MSDLTFDAFNPILDTDSYKLSHFLQYPPGTRGVSAYVEARPGGRFERVLFFGLQMWLKRYLSQPVARAHIDEAEELVAAHGLPFNRAGWERVVERHGGLLPLAIEALPEGTVVPVGTPLVQVETTDPELFWLATYVETALLRAVWYPSTVATVSFHAKEIIRAALERTCEDPASVLPFRLHDFGARGTTSHEQAGIGGAAHLVNFQGTDTVTGLVYARRFYGEPMAGFSIPAAEHSTMTAWGEAREADAFRHMVETFGGPGKLVAVVSDSYDLDRAVERLWGDELRELVKASGATVVVRPDSGDPLTVPVRTVDRLGAAYGVTVNAKGFKVLDPAVRVIQGDGIDIHSIPKILANLEAAGWSAENLAFGMGGGLLQKVDRDTLAFAMKANAVKDADGAWRAVHKRPKTDPRKASKAGRLAVACGDGRWSTHPLDGFPGENRLVPVWRDGRLLVDHAFAEVRARAAS